ncbi:MAG: sodium-dependent transporter [Bdellovibrionaceae bacterium]|nr:sodium-dependent transporter [Pseudobdellovibrionaceae bacterium]
MILKVWGARLGFFLALVASASGLGNLWRFPYVVAENGGGGFVILYIFLVLIVGLPLLIGELLVGRLTGKSILSSLSFFKEGKRTRHLGNLSILVCLLVLGYFSVISSWVLFFFFKYAIALFTSQNFVSQSAITQLMEQGWLQMLLTALHITLLFAVVGKELEDGLEKFVGYLMPLFAVILCMLVWRSLSLSTAEEAMRYLFYPNFSDLNWSSLSSALGQVLFTLSLGFTTMVTFGSLLPKDTDVPKAGVGIASIDSVLSILAGMLIFPLLLGGTNREPDPLMLFQAVPEFINQLPGGNVYGFLFFLFLYLVAFGASISLLETVVSNFSENHRLSRVRASFISGTMCFLLSLIPVLATSYLSHIKIRSSNLLVVWDHLLVNWLMPLIALMIALWICYGIPNEIKEAEFKKNDTFKDDSMFKHWIFMMMWAVPIITILAIILNIVGILQ